jgi:hypothetical protein
VVLYAPTSGEDKSPLNITADRAHEGAVLVARDRHGVVLHYVHQVHLFAARKTKHRPYPIGPVLRRSCDDGVKRVRAGLSTARPPTTDNFAGCSFRATNGQPPQSVGNGEM